jgi:imidazole glycerol-phosphate synthase subunit HisF
MLKIRVIPTLLWKNLGLVKGIGFDSWRRVGTIMPAVKVYNTRQVDELIVVDISATSEGRVPDFEEVREFSAECFVPLTVGGGIRSIEDIKQLLRAGADKVSINTAAFEQPELINEAAERFGSQCVLASIDARKNSDGSYSCMSRSGTQDTGWEPGDWAEEIERRGAGEILITSIERDGTMEGYDLELIRHITSRVRIPVIASGGAGNYEHLFEALVTGRAAAVAAASIFHFTEQTPQEAKNYLASRGIPVRNAKVLV